MAPRIQRRALLLGALGVAATAALGVWYRRRRRAHVAPPLDPSATGPIDDGTSDLLLATTTALVDGDVEPEHYADYFRFHAQNVPGYRDLYERFAARVAEAARRAGVADFAAARADVRRTIVVDGCLPESEGTATLPGGPDEEERDRYRQYVVAEILDLFSATDAWILLGYEDWPGNARGLDRYTSTPR